MVFQSTHPSWGATNPVTWNPDDGIISIHAPIVGCDIKKDGSKAKVEDYFNPRTHRGVRLKWIRFFHLMRYFNPRTHRGVRRGAGVFLPSLFLFQSTHPSWGATLSCNTCMLAFSISIHAPIVGCDCTSFTLSNAFTLFQSTHPSWGATMFHG